MMRPFLRRVLLAVAVTPTLGCYEFTAISVSDLRPGVDVRTQISGAGLDRLRRGPEGQAVDLRSLTISGQVAAVGSDSVLLRVPRTLLEADFRAQVVNQHVQLARSEVTSVSSRQLNRRKTAFLVAGLAALGTAVVIGVHNGAGASNPIVSPGGPPEQRIPFAFLWSTR